MVYEYVDENSKSYNNELVVSFSFPNHVTVEQAVLQIDELVNLADNNDDIEFEHHTNDIYAKSPFSIEPDEY